MRKGGFGREWDSGARRTKEWLDDYYEKKYDWDRSLVEVGWIECHVCGEEYFQEYQMVESNCMYCANNTLYDEIGEEEEE